MLRKIWRAGPIDRKQRVAVEDAVSVSTPVWPMAAGVAAALLALEFVVAPLRRGTLPVWGIVVVATLLMFMAVSMSGFVVRTIYTKRWPGMRSAPLVKASGLVALWVPAWVLLMETGSGLMVAAGRVCLACLGIFLKRCAVNDDIREENEVAVTETTPFLLEFDRFSRVMLPSVLLALLAEAAVVLVAARWFVAASLAGGAFAAVVGWKAMQRLSQIAARPILPVRSQNTMASAAFVLTLVALLPFLKVGPLFGGLIPKLHGSSGAQHGGEGRLKEQLSSSDGYSGIVLLAPRAEQKRIVAPVRHDVTDYSVKLAQPMEIPFDGAYWYFKAPDKMPRPSARVVRGSSLKATIRSSDYYPLLMEAHQRLSDSIDLGCCSSIGLVVQNGDRREGAIALELWVRNRLDPKSADRRRVGAVAPENLSHYLGTVTIPSSEHPHAPGDENAAPPDERLVFPVPPAMEGVRFDEISVVVRSSPARARVGAKIAIRKFVLQP